MTAAGLAQMTQTKHCDNAHGHGVAVSLPATHTYTRIRLPSFPNLLTSMIHILHIIVITTVYISWWEDVKCRQGHVVAVCMTPAATVWPICHDNFRNINCQTLLTEGLHDKESRKLYNLTSCIHLFPTDTNPSRRGLSVHFPMASAASTGGNSSVSQKTLIRVKQVKRQSLNSG